MKPTTISLCVIAYNEERYLPSLLDDIAAQTYPHELIEVVLVDGASNDKTKNVMLKFADSQSGKFRSIIVANNPKRVQPAGWNVALMNTTCDVITRIDAHTSIPANFVALNMRNLQAGENVSGGVRPCLIENKTAWGEVLLQTENSLFGSSMSKSRHGTEKQYVKTMFHASYRREVFTKAGGFNKNLLRTEDNELHCRIREAGYKLYFDPEIISYQYARSSLRKMIRQKYGNGYWIGLTLGVRLESISVYHLIPFAFLTAIIGSTFLTSLGLWQFAAVMWAVYLVFSVISMIIAMVQNGFKAIQFLMPFLFLILHISYGAGTLVGLIQMPLRRKRLYECPEIEQVKMYMQATLNQ